MIRNVSSITYAEICLASWISMIFSIGDTQKPVHTIVTGGKTQWPVHFGLINQKGTLPFTLTMKEIHFHSYNYQAGVTLSAEMAG